MKKIIWLSANEFGYKLLLHVFKHMNTLSQHIYSIITLSEKATTIMYDGVEAERWQYFGIPVFEIENINSISSAEIINNQEPDLVVVAGWRQMIIREILETPKLGCVGFHPTLLPRGRGPASIINTILTGEKHSGVTLFHLSDGIDNGDIIAQHNFYVPEGFTTRKLYDLVIEEGKGLLGYLKMVLAGTAPRTKQNESRATYCSPRSLKDNEIDLLNDPLELIDRKVRAFGRPYRGAYIRKDGGKLTVWEADYTISPKAKVELCWKTESGKVNISEQMTVEEAMQMYKEKIEHHSIKAYLRYFDGQQHRIYQMLMDHSRC